MKLNKFSRIIRSSFLACLATVSASVSAEVVDVLVLYTPEARDTRYGTDIDARISAYIAYANAAYQNSEVGMQLRLVGSQMVDVPYDRVDEANLSDFSRDPLVEDLREQTGADLVTLLNLRQEMSGGYVCGIGYVPQGRSDTGRFYSYAPSAGFSLVGIDCGVSTFAHELGHNMGLGHSSKQNSSGGVWPWGRGHGVNGLFSTIMAYPQSYGTYNQLPMFSNPQIANCVDLACGVDRDQSNGADSAASLTALATQIAAFRPTVIGDSDMPDDDLPGSGNPTQYCANTPTSGNFIRNGDFDSLDNWQSGFGLSLLEVEAFAKTDCLENRLVVGGRTSSQSSAAQFLSEPLRANTHYKFKGEFAIRGGSRETVRFALRVRSTRGSYYLYLDPVSVTANELTQVSQNFSFPSGQIDAILVYGPRANVDIVMDKLAISVVTD